MDDFHTSERRFSVATLAAWAPIREAIRATRCWSKLAIAVVAVALTCAGKPAEAADSPAMPAGNSALDGLITLDPVCELMASPTPRLAPGNPAPSTRRMVQAAEAGRSP